MATQPLIIERTLHASAEKVWQALTDNSQMKKWYFDMESFEPRVGFEFEFYGSKDDTRFLHHCQVTEVIPNKKLSYTWRYKDYPGNSKVSFELFPEGDATRVRITHTGLDSFPQDNPDFAVTNFTAGWEYILGTNLKDFVEKQ
jgi:uncharacterized protein YndB with AHSA1/START domain